jgi:hypothetical protein
MAFGLLGKNIGPMGLIGSLFDKNKKDSQGPGGITGAASHYGAGASALARDPLQLK